MKQFTTIADVPDLSQLVQAALDCKANPFGDAALGKNKTIGLLFFNPSLRTRLSTQKAAQNLGMSVMSMDLKNGGWALEFEDGVIMNGSTAEHIREGAAVVSQYCDIIGVRTFPSLTDKTKDYSEQVLQQFIRHASVPVVSLESATRHPLQSLTDLMTIKSYQNTARPKVVLSWAPHPKALPQAVANSFVEWMLAADMDLTITHPEGYELSPDFAQNAPVEYDQNKALAEADFVYTKNWSAFNDYGKIITPKSDWMITAEKMAKTKEAYFMHCLPVRRNVIVADSVIDSPKSLVIEQANNRTFAAQAVLKEILLSNV